MCGFKLVNNSTPCNVTIFKMTDDPYLSKMHTVECDFCEKAMILTDGIVQIDKVHNSV